MQIKDHRFSCAISDIDGVSEQTSPRNKMIELLRECHGEPRSIGIFTAAGRRRASVKYGNDFVDFIFDEGLGEVETSNPIRNRNTGNYITVYIWNVDQKAVLKWYVANVKA